MPSPSRAQRSARRRRSPSHALSPNCAASILATIAATATPAGALANVVRADWFGSFAFDYRIIHMPDFDQRRSFVTGIPGLPGNGGMHCVPTCATNLFAYAANHGFPSIPPGNQPWFNTSDQAQYNQITLWIDLLGGSMETDPEDGTGADNQYNAIKSHLGIFAPGRFTVTQQCASGSWSPTTATIAKASIFGGLTCFTYGRYFISGSTEINGQTIFFVIRDGGHCVTLVAADRILGQTDATIEVRDPNSSDSQLAQGAFSTKQYIGKDEFYARDSSSSDPFLLSKIRTMTRISSADPSILFVYTNEKVALIDSYTSIRPKAGYSFTNEQIPPAVKIHTPIAFAGHDAFQPPAFELNGFSNIAELVQSPDLQRFAALGTIDGVKGIALVDPIDQSVEPFALNPAYTDIAFGRDRRLYAAIGSGIHRFDLDKPQPTPEISSWPFAIEGIAFDDTRDEIVTIGRFGINFAVRPAACPTCPPTFFQIPPSVPVGPIPSIAVCPETGAYIVFSDASPKAFILARDTTNTLTLLDSIGVDGCTPRSVTAGDDGSIFILCDGSVAEFRHDGSGNWPPVQDSVFAGLTGIAQGFAAEVSRTNFNPAEHDVPGWNNNVLPQDLIPLPPILDCIADLDADRDVDSDDLSILLGSFGNNYLGDLDVDQDTDSDDLTILLSAFGQPCP
ncbi:MAG: hypothetical protein ACTS3F_06155 [Phycisphaerales bacterium]